MYPQPQMMNPQGNMQQWNGANNGFNMTYPQPRGAYTNGMPQQQMLQEQQMQQMPQEQVQQHQQMQYPQQQQQPQYPQQQQQQPQAQQHHQMQRIPPSQPPMWGGPPPYYHGYGNQGMYDPRYTGQVVGGELYDYDKQRPPAPNSAGCQCCAPPTEPLDPYCCGQPPNPEGPLNCFGSICDRTSVAMIFFFLLSVSAFISLIAISKRDDLLASLNITNYTDLDAKFKPYIKPVKAGCRSSIFYDKEVCMKDGIDINTLLVQLRTWSRQRNTMYFLAMIYSIFGVLYAFLVDFHRRQSRQSSEDCQTSNIMTHSGRPSTGPTGGRGYQEGHMNDGQLLPAGPRGQASNGAVQVYGTPFYEFMRVAWFVMGVAAIAWMYTLLMSYCSYSAYYRARAKGELLEFLISYHIRFLATVTCVTIYLAWPISNIIIEFALWIVFFIPWVIYRSLRKPNIGYLRPALPLDEMPGCIRLDMFFMDFTGMRRLGFSDPAWRLLTGTSQPLLPTCVDESTIDRDPMMPSLQQFGSTWSPNGTVMYPQMPMNQGQTQPHMMQQPQQQGPGNVVPGTEMSEGDNEEVQDRGRRHRRDRSRRRGERSAHRGTEEAGESVEPQGISPTRARSQTPGGGDEDAQGERHRRSRRSRSRRHSVRGGDWDNLDGTGGETRHRRHRRTGDAANSSRGNPTPQEIDRMLDEL